MSADYLQYIGQISTALNQNGESGSISLNGNKFSAGWFLDAISGNGTNNGTGSGNSSTFDWASIINSVMKVVGQIFAQRDVDSSKKKIDEGNNKGEKVNNETSDKINEIISQINTDIESIQTAISKIEQLCGSEGLEAAKEQLEDTKSRIQKALDIINNPDADETDKNSALVELEACSELISQLLAQVDLIQQSVTEQTQGVQQYTESIEAQQGIAEQTIETALQTIENIVVETSAEGTKNVKYIAEGGEEITLGVEAQAAAATIEAGTLGMGTAVAASAEEKALKLIDNGKTHISGGSENLTSLGSALNNLGGKMATVSSYTTAIGDALGLAQGIIGEYSTSVSDILTSVGSWNTVRTANNELSIAISDYKENIEKSEKSSMEFINFDVSKFELETA